MLRIRQIKVPVDKPNLEHKLVTLLRINNNDLVNYKILKKSIDARDKNNVCYIYECVVELKNEEQVLNKNHSKDIEKYIEEKYTFPYKNNSNKKVTIIGSGPAGLFCAYTLASNGYKVEVIERGEKVEDRIKTVEEFWNTGKLNTSSNVQFGEGGAGTFSDGKLTTQIKDQNNRMNYVLQTFVDAGAPEEILYEAKPHIGTDILVNVVKNIREKIILLGGSFRYNTTLTDIEIEDNKIKTITLNNKEKQEVDNLVLAIGHSARDTFEMLNKKLNLEAKSFAVGIRISHPQSMINNSQYGEKYSKYLPPASYKLTYQTKSGRGVYSFCMCPGGYVVNASSEENRLAVNGMSYSKRDSENANSALIVTVTPKDFGESPLSGLEFQRKLEENAYKVGNKSIPVQQYIDFKNKEISTSLGEVNPVVKGKYTLSDINKIFPDYINESLVEAIENFGTKIKGYNRDDALLMGVESRTSSPVRIPRDEEYSSIIKGIYPCGEGAGYAGGITSAAIDGVKVAEAIAKKCLEM